MPTTQPHPHRLAMHTVLAVLAVQLFSLGVDTARAESVPLDDWYLEAIRVPENLRQDLNKRPIIVAVVDDGMRITHKDLAEFIWTNPLERSNNHVDDDGNGFIDDTHGWDVSDEDNDVGAPDYRPDFYHGTHIAGIVATIARTAYGESAPDRIRILPIKALADSSEHTYIKGGYEGIRYAVQMGADIIICAWGMGQISAEQSAILQSAADKGVLIVSAAGNLPEEREQFPAAHQTVLAVGSIERDGAKTDKSNFGKFVDISAPGTGIESAGIDSDQARERRDGTSMSTAMVAAAAALVKISHPELDNEQVKACLISSSKPMPIGKREYSAKLGAGSLQIDAAVICDLFTQKTNSGAPLIHPKGYLRTTVKKRATTHWTIEPLGEFAGIRFMPAQDAGPTAKGVVEFRANNKADAEVIASYPLDNPPESIYVPGTTVFVSLKTGSKRSSGNWLLKYEAQPIDFSRLYCHGTKRLSTEGMISDGSGPEHYSSQSDCKWLITAPEGKVVRFQFDALDTEPRTDMIYFFNGERTNSQIMALFSGRELPPEFTTWSNQVLVWFLSDDQNQGQGWHASYTFEDP